MFRSDFADTFQEVWNWFGDVVKDSPTNWNKNDWKRLVDLYRLSMRRDAEKFDELSRKLKENHCVPNKATLIEIGEWKARGRLKKLLDCRHNCDEHVKKTTHEAFKDLDHVLAEKKDDPSWSVMSSLRSPEGLHGVQVPMASTLLAMYRPECYPVIDRLAYSLLFGITDHDVEITSQSQWMKYLTKIQQLAHDHELRCRDIDAALWFVSLYKRDEVWEKRKKNVSGVGSK